MFLGLIDVDMTIGDGRLVIRHDLVIKARTDRDYVRHRIHGQGFDVHHALILHHPASGGLASAHRGLHDCDARALRGPKSDHYAKLALVP